MSELVDTINRFVILPAGCWTLDFRPSHLIAAGKDDPQLAVQASAGPAFTLIVHGRVGAIFGFVLLWRGLAEAWMVVTPHVRPIALPFSRQSRKLIDIVALSLHLRRVQIHVHTANLPAARWAKVAGFAIEATLPFYTADGQDVYLMSRIYGGRE
jgi:hypothetical protein